MPHLANTIPGVKAWKYQVRDPASRLIAYEIPGFDGFVYKNLNKRPVTIIETGWCEPRSVESLKSGKGDPTQTATVDTRGRGSYANCYIEDIDFSDSSVGDGTNAKSLRYTRRWVQKQR